jgi:DNA-directed RNA polymerase specialized sigma24 family protein
MVVRIGADLFAAWQRRDLDARNEVWSRLYVTAYSFAVAFCRGLAPDDLAAEEWGHDAIVQVFCEVDARIESFTWQGDSQFTGVMITMIKRRALDGFRAHYRYASRTDDLFFGTDDDRNEQFENAARVAAPQAMSARTHDAIAALISRLAQARERCRTRPALVDVVNATIDYVHDCCGRATIGVETKRLPLDEIVPLMDHGAFEASTRDLNAFVRERLKIDGPTLLDRRREIRVQLGLKPRCRDGGVSTAL